MIIKCVNCNLSLLKRKLEENLNICYKCNFHFQLTAKNRCKYLLDVGSMVELYDNILPSNLLKFFDIKNYCLRLIENQIKTKQIESLLIVKGKVKGLDLVICVFEFSFIGGSMSCSVGDKFLKAVFFCIKYKIPLVCFSASGGVRMQESTLALFQMLKVSFIIKKLKQYKIPYISIIVNPCFGGVSASISMLGDIILAEPKALIGFTGPKVIQDVFHKKLPDNFQSSEFLFEKGFIDFIVNRKILRSKIKNILTILLKYNF